MLNQYVKYCQKVRVAKCYRSHEKGAIITMTTSKGLKHFAKVYNLLKAENGFLFYSVYPIDAIPKKNIDLSMPESLQHYKALLDAETKIYEAKAKTHTKDRANRWQVLNDAAKMKRLQNYFQTAQELWAE